MLVGEASRPTGGGIRNMVQVSGELRIRVERRDRICVVSLKGPLDSTASIGLTECIKTEQAAGPARLVIDMSGVSSVDFGGASALALAARPAGGQCPVIERSLRPAARQQLELTGFDFGWLDSGRPAQPAQPAKEGPQSRGLDQAIADSATGILVREWRYLLGSAEHAISDGRRTAQSIASTEDHVAATFVRLAARRPAAADRLGCLAQTARGNAAVLRQREDRDAEPAAPARNRLSYAASGT